MMPLNKDKTHLILHSIIEYKDNKKMVKDNTAKVQDNMVKVEDNIKKVEEDTKKDNILDLITLNMIDFNKDTGLNKMKNLKDPKGQNTGLNNTNPLIDIRLLQEGNNHQ
jgi:hypothetical protein